MMTTKDKAPQPADIEALLPWHAAGTLSRRDAERVETALAHDPELARRYALVRDELAETIHLNETLGAPSARAMERLMAAIEAEAPAAKPAFKLDLGGRIAEWLSGFSPRTLAWSATAGALAIMLQAGLIAGMFVGETGGKRGFETASFQPKAPVADGSYALIGFAPQASAADVTRFLEASKASVVDGPRAGGLYKVRVAATALPKEQLAEIVKKMQAEGAVVRFAAPGE